MATQTTILPPTVSNPWWGHDPSDKQLEALWAYEECLDLFYGGAGNLVELGLVVTKAGSDGMLLSRSTKRLTDRISIMKGDETFFPGR